VLDLNLVLKSDELYLAGEISTDGSGERATGLYLRDTRHLNRFETTLNRVPLTTLSARRLGPASAVVTSGNAMLAGADGPVLPNTVAVEQVITLGAELEVRYLVRNYAGRPVALDLEIEASADLRDLFDIRGFHRAKRGTLLAPTPADDGVRLGYRALDGVVSGTEITFDQPATLSLAEPGDEGNGEVYTVLLPGQDMVTARPPAPVPPLAVAAFRIDLPANGAWEMTATVRPLSADGVPVSAAPTLAGGRSNDAATIITDHHSLNRLLDQCHVDLTTLQTSFPEGSLPAAGIPWYVAPFGRDSLIVCLQTLYLAPHRAAGTLRVLAALQGDAEDAHREEEPGKIPHEVRYGEMARLREIPHTPYYGTVDATPLWLMLFADTVAWTGDAALYHELCPNAERALDWIERYGDVDGDGLVEYRSGRMGAGISHQGWKDSHDSLHHADGTPVSGAIALVEVQGYVYAAYTRLATVAAAFGDADWAADLTAKAETLRARVEDRFWLETEGFYAQALDDAKTPVAAISSNPGHLLYCGLPSQERAALMAERFRRPDLDCGWGIRTLAEGMPTYNPMSYHNGSVWPHDNSLIADGLLRYGFAPQAHAILDALLAASRADPLARLPELYCGFARNWVKGDTPVAYPVSCSPQAWAAAAVPLIVSGLLGLRMDAARGVLMVDPDLPAGLGEIAIQGMEVRGQRSSLIVRRQYDAYVVSSDGPIETIIRGRGAR